LSADSSTQLRRAPAAAVSVVSRPLWQLRLIRALPRYLFYGVCLSGLLASARFALAPPQARPLTRSAPSAMPPDVAAEGYAALFARRYLTWDAQQPQRSEQLLTAMGGSGLVSGAGLSLPATGRQQVLWAEVVQARRLGPGGHMYTVAAQTSDAGLLYLTVGVVRRTDGALSLTGYPAFVGAPAAGPAQVPERSAEVTDPALATVVVRATRNYLAASPGELAADLSAGARVAVPTVALTLDSVQRLDWASDRRSVLLVVQAEDGRGARYTLAYELDVTDVNGRWEVSAIQMDPDS
jgi:hypothetical protein